MKASKLPSLALAVALQVLPISRVFIASTPTAGSSFAIISTWIAGAFALLGSYDSVSGASSISITPTSATNGVRFSGLVQYSGGHAADAKSWELVNNWNGAQSGCNNVYQIAPGLWLTNAATYLARVGGTPTATGTYNFTLKIHSGSSCGGGDSDTRSASITIYAGSANSPPVANAQSVTNAEDTAKAITLTGSDPNGNPITYVIVSQPTHGTLSGTAPSVSYLPATNYSGSDSFTFKVNDGSLDSPPATVSITITPVGTPTNPTLGQPTFGLGGLSLTASGSPGQSWAVERATQLGSGWTNIGTLLIAPNGTGQFQDTNPPSGRAFFRLAPP